MPTDIQVPTLGESITEATVAKWLKQKGDAVSADEPLVELETDKVTLEVNAPVAGFLSEILVPEGENVEVGALLGRIEKADGKEADPSSRASASRSKAAPAAAAKAETAQVNSKVEPHSGEGEVIELKVPALGESVTEATVAKWLKTEGQSVARDEPLVELETDKVTLEVNAPSAGVLSKIAAQEGTNVEVGALLGTITAGQVAVPQQKDETPAAPREEEGPQGADEAPLLSQQFEELDPTKVTRSGEGGRITAEDLKRFLERASSTAAVTLSPAVLNLVAEHGLDVARIPATGPQGRLTKEDVLAVIEGRRELLPKPQVKADQTRDTSPSPAPAGAPLAAAMDAKREERVRMSRLRQTIARRLKEAQNTAAMLTTFNEADMSAVMALRAKHREAFEKKHGVKLGFTSFFAKAVVAALREVPEVNARIEGDEIVYNKFFDIGMAVSTPQGLMVPIIRDCDKKSFAEIEIALADVAKRARDGKLTLEEMQGGSFTITNGGVFGSLLSTPILNVPQSGILGLHKIQQRPVAVDGKLEIRPMMYLAHSYDHRLVDGREAVTFLVKVKEAIEDPERLLLEL